jgi:hypothetical protein
MFKEEINLAAKEACGALHKQVYHKILYLSIRTIK